MIAVLGALFGAVTGLLPGVLEFFNKREDFKHQIALLEMQMKAGKQNVQLQMDLENVRADNREGDSVRRHDASIRGGGFMDALRASVRPVITYCFFFLFAAVEIAAIYHLSTNTNLNFTEIMNSVWDDDIKGLFASVFGFWFGSRAYKYHMSNRIPRKNDDFRGVY